MAEISGQTIRFEEISKCFGDFQALCPTSLEIKAGEFLTLLGPSGSGKTTLLNVTAGYLDPSQGRVFIGGRDVTSLAPRYRNIGMVFQNFALFPHMSVAENVAYGLKVRKCRKPEIERRVDEALALVQLGELADRAITDISGGQQQRVALARAMVVEPDVLLMDEPLGALDRQLRKHVQLEIRRLHVAHLRTTIYVTHDQEEALVMSDRIGLMRKGRIVQIGTPKELYGMPKNTFVASFLGESNLIEGKVVDISEGVARLECPQIRTDITGIAAEGISIGMRAAALIRPENASTSDGENGVEGSIVEVVYLGELQAIKLRLADGSNFWLRCIARLGIQEQGTTWVTWDSSKVCILPIAL